MTMEIKFNISFTKLINDFLPVGLRSASIKAMARAAFITIQSETQPDLWEQFATARTADRFKLEHNGQVCYLRAALNKQFKSITGAYFQISETLPDIEWIYANTEAGKSHIIASNEQRTEKHKLFAPDEKILQTENTFIIHVPSDLYATRLDQIKQFVNEYKLVTRKPQYEPI